MSRRGVAPPNLVRSVADQQRRLGKLERGLGYRDWSRVKRNPLFDPLWPSGKPPATVLVAASDSIAAGAADADYVCDGTNDHTELQSACDAADSEDGLVLLLEGTYNLAGGSLTVPASVTLAGMGAGTILKYASGSGALVTLSAGARIRHLAVDRNVTNQVAISVSLNCHVIDCTFSGGGGPTAYINAPLATPALVSNCFAGGDGGLYSGFAPRRMENCFASGFSLGWGVDFTGSVGECVVAGLNVSASSGSSGGMRVQAAADSILATGVTLATTSNSVPALEWAGDEGQFVGACYRGATISGNRNQFQIRVKGPTNLSPLLTVSGAHNSLSIFADGERTSGSGTAGKLVSITGDDNTFHSGHVMRGHTDLVEISGDRNHIGSVTLNGATATGYNLVITPAAADTAVGKVNSWPVAGTGALNDLGTATRTL